MLKKIAELLTPLKKECFKIMAHPEPFSPDQCIDTRFGGIPYQESGCLSPVCSGCSAPLSFIFQFHDTPDKSESELLQFFYCFNCSPWGGKQEEGQWLVRSYEQPVRDKFVAPAADENELLPCKTEIQPVSMLPDFETLEEMGHEVVKLCEKVDKDDPWDVYEETCLALGCTIEPFSSVGGYPIWIQGPSRKNCPDCKKEMEFIAQIDSVAEAQLMWGDAGCVYLFRCHQHRQKFAFEMQCF